jgi:hypothetical protein
VIRISGKGATGIRCRVSMIFSERGHRRAQFLNSLMPELKSWTTQEQWSRSAGSSIASTAT